MSTDCPVFLVNDTRVDAHHGCTAVMTALERLILRHHMSISARWPAHIDWRNNPEFARALAAARLVVINGEGTIHHDRPSGRRLLEIGSVARAAGIPVALVNTGWEANGPELTSLLANFSLVSARDTQSAAAMRAGAPSVRVVPDLSLCSHPPATITPRKGIGFADNVERLRALELARLKGITGGRWLSIHHRRQLHAFLRSGISLRSDIPAPARLARLVFMRHGLWQVSQDDLRKFLAELAGLEFLVSGRFHACTLALVTGTPFVAQASNTGKIAALIADSGLDIARSAIPSSPAELIDLAKRGWTKAENEARLDYLALARKESEDLAADLRALAL
jgi:polysaccharide pyruvyl transferase WcaK-like protein